jgi:hypothetical protein
MAVVSTDRKTLVNGGCNALLCEIPTTDNGNFAI